jgi:transposase
MSIDSAALPDDVALLKRIIADMATEAVTARAEIEKLKAQLSRLRRLQFGRSSEKLEAGIAQLELLLEDAEAAGGEREQKDAVAAPSVIAPERPVRRPLPEHLPREEVVHGPASAQSCRCPRCGGAMRRLGEDVTEVLEMVPARFKVVRHVRPKYSCRACETITQAPMPSLPIERGRPGAGLLAHVLVGKYADHLPLYRQAEIYARDGVDLDRSTLADWVGKAAWLLRPLVEALGREVTRAERLFADDTPVPVLAPGTGKTRTGRLWAYVRDDRPFGGTAPPAALYRYTPDRRGEHPRRHLEAFSGFLQADGYAGFKGLYDTGRISEVACWRMCAASSSMCTRRTAQPSPARRSTGSVRSTRSNRTSAAGRPASASRCGRRAPGRCWTASRAGWRRATQECPARASSPPPCATP